MMKRLWLAALLPLLLAAKKDEAPVNPGPQPTFADGVSLGEAEIRARLIDPGSAQIEWPYAFTGGYVRSLLSKRQVGWFTCGQVNSRNRMGGYTGRAWFLLVINNGVVTSLEIGDGSESFDVTGCTGIIKKGLLQPAPAPELPVQALPATAEAGASSAAAKGGLGISFAPAPVGAVLMAVSPGSRAARAGLKPGETIETINGVGLKGLPPEAMTQVLQSTTGPVTLGIVGVGPVQLP